MTFRRYASHIPHAAILLGIAAIVGLSAPPAAVAQTIVRGTVTDATSGLPLPSANIVVEGTYQGTITNADGEYQLETEVEPARLIVRYLGYESQRRALGAAPLQRVDFALEPVTYRMPEVVVSDENPAVPIMQCVIDRKQAWRAHLASYSADAYTRFTVSNDTGIVSIVESLSEVFWERDRGSREVVRSQRQTSNLNLSTYLPAARFVANFYDDDIELAGYRFVGVTHPRAFDTYRFTLEGTRMMDDRLVYEIAVAPRNRLKTAFSGTLAVLADECALLDVALTPGEAFLFPPPIRRLEMTFFQQYNRFDGEAWLPADFRSDIELEISMGFLMSFPPFRVRQVSRLTDYDLDVEVPDTLFEREDFLTVDEEAVEADTLLSEEGAAVPLDSLERMAYRTIDSTMTLDKAFAPSGALARVTEMEREDDRDRTRPRMSFVDRLHLDPVLRFNRVESFHGGASTEHEIGRFLLGAGVGWSSGLSENAWSYRTRARLRIGPRRRGFVGASFSDGVEPRYRSSAYVAPMTSLYGLLGGGDYFDYVSTERLALEAGYEREEWSLSARVSRERPRSVEPATSYDLLGRRSGLQPNPPVESGDLRSVAAVVRIGEDERTLGFVGKRHARLEIERGWTDAYGAFTRIAVEGDWRTETFFKRRMLPNVLDVHLTAGTRWGDLPVTRFGVVDGSLGAYRPFGVLRTMTGRPYEGDRFAGLMWEHSFRTVPFEMTGLHGLARRGYGIILTGGHAKTWIPSSRADRFGPLDVPDGVHHEIGFALSGLFGVLRVDFTARLDEPGATVGMSAARIF